MSFTVSKDFSFEASHQLDPKLLGKAHKCCRLHGHSYRVRVYVRGELDKRGFVVDYAELSAAMDPLIASFDHRFLNDLLPFHTTAENLAKHIFDHLRYHQLKNVSRVDVFETARTCCTYEP
jgi:6-pyruvoyltetrahydropterin/6-carboxytetrahydropterin synthase